MKTKKGFTLIELLVVIAIIGILSSIGLVALNGAKEKARDAKKKNDLTQYRNAILMYFDDHDRTYIETNDIECINHDGENYTYSLGVYTPSASASMIFSNPGGPLVTEYLANNLKPLLSNGNEVGSDYYCYDINQVNKDHFLLFTKLESGDKLWYWLNDENTSGTESVPHDPSHCDTTDCLW